MNIYLYNTLGRKKEEFKPIKRGTVSFYYCGPTVYWTQHVGNLRGSFCADLVRRVFEYNGNRVKMVRNYTDVGHLTSDEDEGEDKIEKGAKREKTSPAEIASKYITAYEQDVFDLNILEPWKKPRATEHIKEMQKMTVELLKKGFAYETPLAVYFDVSKSPGYTCLSGQKPEMNISGAGKGDVLDKGKKNYQDFALWFFRAGVHKNAIQYWPSPFNSPLVKKGEGFPGWHIECSAMSKKYLGETIDIHMGGIEHIPTHHTNEIAQSEAVNGKKFANYWIHNEHLLFDDGKMSKSKGTSFNLSEVKEKGFWPLALRYFFLQAHYSSKQNFTWEALQSAQNGLGRLYGQIRELNSIANNKKGRADLEFKNKFIEKINNDFNSPEALAIVFDLLKSDLSEKVKLATLLDFDKVFGLDFAKQLDDKKIPDEIQKMIEERNKARAKKDWQESDRLRAEIESRGYSVKDGAEGTKIDTAK